MSNSPPPLFSYSYSLNEPTAHAPYAPHGFQGLPTPIPDYTSQSLCLPSLPASLPSMAPYEYGPTKEEACFDDDDVLSHYHMGYRPLAAIDMANAHVSIPGLVCHLAVAFLLRVDNLSFWFFLSILCCASLLTSLDERFMTDKYPADTTVVTLSLLRVLESWVSFYLIPRNASHRTRLAAANHKMTTEVLKHFLILKPDSTSYSSVRGA